MFADRALAQRLERAEGASGAQFVEARVDLFPESDAEWKQVAGAYAIYDGPSSPATQTFGLGLFDPVTEIELDELEKFFLDRGAPVLHEVSPLADKSLFSVLSRRHYEPVEFTSVLYAPLAGRAAPQPDRRERFQMRQIGPGDEDVWAQAAARGWGELPGLEEFIRTAARVNTTGKAGRAFLVELDGKPIATASLLIHNGVAHFAGASTVPEARRLGAQAALLEKRFQVAAEEGCDVVLMGAEPGSVSQRNAERQGFRIAYTRTKWRLPERQS